MNLNKFTEKAQEAVQDPLALLSGEFGEGETIEMDFREGSIVFAKVIEPEIIETIAA